MSATLNDLAIRAGVSKSTVSRALRNHPRISKATCERIQSLALELDYRPDPLIATWINRRWGRQGRELGTIAWLTSFPAREHWLNYPFIAGTYEGARQRAAARGYQLEHFWLREPGMTAKRMGQILTSRGIRGVCIAPLPTGRAHLNFQWEDFSCAAIGFSLMRPELHRASPHQFQGISLALRELRRKGFRRIGVYIDQAINIKVNYNWLAGVLLFQEQNRLTRISHFITQPKEGLERLQAWLDETKPEVILASTGDLIDGLRAMGRQLPVAVLAWHKQSGFPGLDQRPNEVGEAAIDLIVGQIQRNETGLPQTPRVMMIPGKWREAEG